MKHFLVESSPALSLVLVHFEYPARPKVTRLAELTALVRVKQTAPALRFPGRSRDEGSVHLAAELSWKSQTERGGMFVSARSRQAHTIVSNIGLPAFISAS